MHRDSNIKLRVFFGSWGGFGQFMGAYAKNAPRTASDSYPENFNMNLLDHSLLPGLKFWLGDVEDQISRQTATF